MFADIAGRVPPLAAAATFAIFLAVVALVVMAASFVTRGTGFFDDRKAIGRSLAAVTLSVPFFAFAFFALSSSSSASPEVHIA